MIMPGIESRNQGGREHATQPDPDQNLACRPFAAAQGLGGHAGAASGRRNHRPCGDRRQGAGPGASRGTCSTRSNSGNRSCDQSCTFPIGSYKLSQCCESSSEERSAGNLHATFCGNRGRATASGDPVGGAVRCPPIPILGGKKAFPIWSACVAHAVKAV